MRKMNKRGWLRIVEAVIAILIIIGSVLVILSRQGTQSNVENEIYQKQKQVLDMISENNSLRGDILIGDNSEVNNAIKNFIPTSWDYSTNICEPTEVCPNPIGIYDKEVYVSEKLITSTLTENNPKKLKLFVWIK